MSARNAMTSGTTGVRSYRLYFKLLSELLTVSKTANWEEENLEGYVTIRRQNTRRSHTTVKQDGCLV